MKEYFIYRYSDRDPWRPACPASASTEWSTRPLEGGPGAQQGRAGQPGDRDEGVPQEAAAGGGEAH